MEFNQKLQELRKKKGLTQEELAEKLYVSRTAISKWESGRGYPNIESLKAIAKFFSVTVDDLLSTDEVLTIAEEDGKEKEKRFRNMLYGLLDISSALLFFLPFFANKGGENILSASLLELVGVQPYLKAIYLAIVSITALFGITVLVLESSGVGEQVKYKTNISLILSTLSVLIFTVSNQPYATVFTFVLLAIKALMLIKRH